ncbi:40S ribosomal protein S11-like [Echinops telfairi]|uniref:40S ribosomal protein S11-like n=1 Tax=Echinops telfairi TaxID=9371 RepID=A0ABM0IPN7_ECHTE|nr:40S ribosomal protein S11-like [Echinops telfairi]
MLDNLIEYAYEKQLSTYQYKKTVLLEEAGKEMLPSYYKNMRIGFKISQDVIEGTFTDKIYPFNGKGSIWDIFYFHDQDEDAGDKCHLSSSLHYTYKYIFWRHAKDMPKTCKGCQDIPCLRDVQIRHIFMGKCQSLSKGMHFNVLKVTNEACTKKQCQEF